MRAKIFLVVFILFGGFVFNVRADTYSTFQTTRYYSANHRFIVVVNENKRATLYHNGRKLHRIWRGTLVYLPNKLFVADDGKRVVIVDRYYGNSGAGALPIVVFLNENGKQLASYLLDDLVNLKRVMHTNSGAEWYKYARLSSDKQSLLIETIIQKYDNSHCGTVTSFEQAEKCSETIPFQELHFALATGQLVERKQIASE